MPYFKHLLLLFANRTKCYVQKLLPKSPQDVSIVQLDNYDQRLPWSVLPDHLVVNGNVSVITDLRGSKWLSLFSVSLINFCSSSTLILLMWHSTIMIQILIRLLFSHLYWKNNDGQWRNCSSSHQIPTNTYDWVRVTVQSLKDFILLLVAWFSKIFFFCAHPVCSCSLWLSCLVLRNNVHIYWHVSAIPENSSWTAVL